MHTSTKAIATFALLSLANAALDVVPPTGQCSPQHAVGHWWTCMSTILGCAWDGASYPCNAPKDDRNIGREFCDVSKGETIVIPAGMGKTSTDNGQQCGQGNVWVMADYTWQCCQCPAGYQPAGIYDPQTDGKGGFTYDTTVTGGTVEKTCMRCTGAGEVLTYDSARYVWSCKGGATTSTTTNAPPGGKTTTTTTTTTTSKVQVPGTTTTTTTKTTTKSTTKTTTTTTKAPTPTTLKTSTKTSSTTTTKK